MTGVDIKAVKIAILKSIKNIFLTQTFWFCTQLVRPAEFYSRCAGTFAFTCFLYIHIKDDRSSKGLDSLRLGAHRKPTDTDFKGGFSPDSYLHRAAACSGSQPALSQGKFSLHPSETQEVRGSRGPCSVKCNILEWKTALVSLHGRDLLLSGRQHLVERVSADGSFDTVHPFIFLLCCRS